MVVVLFRLLCVYLLWKVFDYVFLRVIRNARTKAQAQQQARSSATSYHYSVSRLDWAYGVLGLKPQCSNDEVRNAYRQLAMLYHPDRTANLGDQVRQTAEKKFQELGQARDIIYAARDMK